MTEDHKKLSQKINDLTRRVILLEDLLRKVARLIEQPLVTEIREIERERKS